MKKIKDNEIVIGKTKNGITITVCKNCEAYSIPHFNYVSKKFAVSFSLLEAKLVDDCRNIDLKERTDLEEFLNTEGCFVWNEQNYSYNSNNLNWFPKYKKIPDNILMPDYSKLNK